MKNSVKLFLVGAALAGLALASSAQATNLDVVRDSRGEKVCTKDGDCVRSKWENTFDECPDKITQNRAVYFAFGSSALTPEGKRTLDALAADIKAKGASVSSIRVVGFADRIGNAAKNEKLSKKRADMVRKYLVSKGVASAQVMETRWFGDSMASAKCEGKMKKSALIKCLQSDRRVEVEVESFVK